MARQQTQPQYVQQQAGPYGNPYVGPPPHLQQAPAAPRRGRPPKAAAAAQPIPAPAPAPKRAKKKAKRHISRHVGPKGIIAAPQVPATRGNDDVFPLSPLDAQALTLWMWDHHVREFAFGPLKVAFDPYARVQPASNPIVGQGSAETVQAQEDAPAQADIYDDPDLDIGPLPAA